MYSYRDNITGMSEAMNRKRAKYNRQQRLDEKSKRDNIIDLTGSNNNSNNIQEQHIDDNGDDITVTYFNNDGTKARTFRSQVNTQTEVAKQSGIKSQLSSDNNNNSPTFITASEDKGQFKVEDNYRKYNPEPMADGILEATGATILHSEITLTDNAGNTRTFVRRKDGTDYY